MDQPKKPDFPWAVGYTGKNTERPFPWTVASERAAMLLAEDEMTHGQIGMDIGYSNGQVISYWLKHPEFVAKVKEHRDASLGLARHYAIAKLNARMAALESRWLALKEIIETRKRDPMMKFVPEGHTGLMRITEVKWFKIKDKDGNEALVSRPTKWSFDVKLCQELRAVEQHAARQMGEWVQQIEVTREEGPKELPTGDFADFLARIFAEANQRRLAQEAQTIEVERSGNNGAGSTSEPVS